MQITQTPLLGALIIEPKVFGDKRGFFVETYSFARYQQMGIPLPFVQDNRSHSTKGVLRGLHYQLEKPQGKLVWVNYGEVLDVAVDIRIGSPTFGKSFSVLLSDQNHKQFYIPPGFAHGFCVLSEEADFCYKCTDYYYPQAEKGIYWNDPALRIEWPINDPILSDKDQNYLPLTETPLLDLPKFYE